MKRIGLMKAICYICIAGGLACKLFIKDATLGSTLAIALLALAIVILALVIRQHKR